jgi:hypothetical protein
MPCCLRPARSVCAVPFRLATVFVVQRIPTVGGRDAEAFTIDGQHYLAFANSEGDGEEGMNVNSTLWKLDGTAYTLVQSIPSNGAYDVQAFSLEVCVRVVHVNRRSACMPLVLCRECAVNVLCCRHDAQVTQLAPSSCTASTSLCSRSQRRAWMWI